METRFVHDQQRGEEYMRDTEIKMGMNINGAKDIFHYVVCHALSARYMKEIFCS